MHAGLSRVLFAGVLAATALGGAIALYVGVQPGRAPPAVSVEKLTIALVPSTAASLLHVAAAKGFFAGEGLEVVAVPATHGRAAVELLAQGKADLATSAEVVFALAVMKGGDLAVAAAVSASSDSTIVARRDRGIAVPADLAGRKIGVTFGTSADYFLWAYFVRHKLAPEAAALVDLPPAEIVRALARGAVDAVATWHPINVEAKQALGDKAAGLADADVYSQTFVLLAHRDFLRGHAPAMRKLARAMIKAEHFMRSQPQEAVALTAGRLHLAPAVLESTWKNFAFRVELLQSHIVTLEDQARWAMARGYAAKGPVPNFLPHLYLDALLAVDPERVTVVH